MRTVTKYLSMLMVILSILVFASQTKAQTTLLTEGWESAAIGTTPPAGWAVNQLGYGNWTSWVASGTLPTAPPYEGARMTDFNSYDAPAGYQNQLHRTVSTSTIGYSSITVDFAEYYQTTFTSGDGITVQWSTNGTTWTSAGANWPNYSTTAHWQVNTQALPVGAANQATLYIAFLFTSQYGYDVYLDICHLKGVQLGNMTGTVRNCLTNAVLPGVNITIGGVPGVTNAAGVYTINNINAGNQPLVAQLGAFTTYNANVNVIGNTTTTYNFCMYPIPGILTGIVTNCANGNPVVGAKVVWGTTAPNLYTTYTTAGGAYSFNVYSAGPYALQVSKEGFMLYNQNGVSVTYPAPPSTTVNVCLSEDTPQPSLPFVAALNAGQTAVNLNWGLPVDDMVLIYDDGIQDNFAIWATGSGNNMNAMKFTPISYPCIVKAFYVNIGQAANYSASMNAFSPVQFDIYNEVGGLPGTAYAGSTTTVTPTGPAYGWYKFAFVAPQTITSGNFYIVMTQLGISTLSPGIAIDTTSNQLRSYSKFGNTPWIPGPGNYMIRAIVNGSGGPLMMGDKSSSVITASAVPGLIYEYAPGTVSGTEGSPKVYPEMGYNPDNLLGYQVWRLTQGQEGTPALWTSVGTPTNTNITDNSWPSLPCQGYRWAAEAQYTFNRWSTAIFSNALGKCWTCNVTVNVTLSCDSATSAGTKITFQNTTVVDTVYNYVMDASGTHTFTNFWKGMYNLTVNKFDYQIYTQNGISIMGDMTINVLLLQFKAAPTGLHVFDTDAFATWFPPVTESVFWTDNFTGGFATNGWVPDAGSHWYINTVDGNPGSCAEWLWSPDVTNYSDNLTSKTLTGLSSAVLKLRYDLALVNYGTTGLDQLAVEVYDGTTWHPVANYDNSSGVNIPYTTYTVDITPFAPSTGFKVRFRSYGADSQYITYWDIDNVKLVAQTNPHDPCIIGYYFWLNGIIDGFTPDTFYHIPPSHMTYGSTYQACVNAVYGSGYSLFSSTGCVNFTDHFLCPPDSVTATAIECSSYITWKKPNCGGCTLKTYQFDGGNVGNGLSCPASTNFLIGNFFPIPATTSGVIKSFDMYFMSTAGSTTAQNCILYVYNSAHVLIGQSPTFVNTGAAYPSGTWVNVAVPDIAYTGPFYAMVDYTVSGTPYKNWFAVDVTTVPTGYPNGLAFSDKSGTFATCVGDPTWGLGAPITFLQRANVCDNSKDKNAPITTIDPLQPPANITPFRSNMAMVTGNVASSEPVNVSAGSPQEITPMAPETVALLGYHVYRNNVQVGPTIMDPNQLSVYDYNLTPGVYSYKVDALYNTAPYNPPTLQANSRKAGPATDHPVCGYPLPFYEPWDMATFTYQQWSFSPNQGNWIMNTAFGDPTPCADFQWDPIVTNYNLSLVSPTINASMYTCADIFCDFDLKLIDRNATGNEKLDVDVMVNGNWINKGEYANNGSVDWTLKHVDISNVQGKAFQVRFRANGASSGDILHWYVDNIHMYAVCHAPTTLAGHQNSFTTTLTWIAPTCSKAGPTPQWIHWDSGSNSTSIGLTAGTGDFKIGARWTPTQITTLDGGSVTKIQFWPATAGTANFRAQIFVGPNAATMVTDQAIPSVTYGQWNIITLAVPHVIDISQELWIVVDVNQLSGYPAGCDAGPAIDNYGDWIYTGTWATLFASGLDYNWNLQAYVEPSKKDAPVEALRIPQTGGLAQSTVVPISTSGKINTSSNRFANTGSGTIIPMSPEGSHFIGYNIYRTPDNASSPFTKVNPGAPVSALTYADLHNPAPEPPTTWKYYVTSVFEDSLVPGTTLCEPSSDTITITFPAVGFNNLSNNTVSLYPNPATDVVNVVSTNDIKTIEVLNYIGQTVYTNNSVNAKTYALNVSTIRAGVYFVKVTTVSGITTSKITVTH